MALEVPSRSILRFGVFEVDVFAGELRKQGVRIKLQEQPFQVLRILLQRPGEVVTREELRNQLWQCDTFVDFDNSLNTAINKLREALGDSADNPRFIETLPRRGYRFIAPLADVQLATIPLSAAESKISPMQDIPHPVTSANAVLPIGKRLASKRLRMLIAKGQPDGAIPELEKTASIMHRSPGSIELLATAYAHAGGRTEALRLLNELKRRRQTSYVPAGVFINPNLGLGDYEQAFVWFERAYQEQSNILQFLKVHPFFDPVREDPRFKDLVCRVGLD